VVNQFLTIAFQARSNNTLHMMVQHVVEGVTVQEKNQEREWSRVSAAWY